MRIFKYLTIFLVGTVIVFLVAQEAFFVAYKTFFRSVAGSELIDLPPALSEKLAPHFNNISKIKIINFNNVFLNSAMTDCVHIYFPNQEVIKQIKNNSLSTNNFHWLLHELVHTEQCFELGSEEDYAGARKKYALRWIKEVFYTGIHIRSFNTRLWHDEMPMEREAEQKAETLVAQFQN